MPLPMRRRASRGLDKYAYRRVAAGFYPPEVDDFSSQVAAFKAADVQILSGLLFPSRFRASGPKPSARDSARTCTVAAAFLFPRA